MVSVAKKIKNSINNRKLKKKAKKAENAQVRENEPKVIEEREETAKREESVYSENIAGSTLSDVDGNRGEVVTGASTGLSKAESAISQIAEEDEKEDPAQDDAITPAVSDADDEAVPVEEVKSAQSGAFAQEDVLSDVATSPTKDAPVAVSKSESAEPETAEKPVQRNVSAEEEVTDNDKSNMKVVNESIEKLGALCFCV